MRGRWAAFPRRRTGGSMRARSARSWPIIRCSCFRPPRRGSWRRSSALVERCFHNGGFFQDIIHSGINAYLTLDIAQTLLRAGDPRYRDLIETVARLASPTGQWPEAIHPHTGGGCMGDGQHGWAAAEWVMMIRNLFVREEGRSAGHGFGIVRRVV